MHFIQERPEAAHLRFAGPFKGHNKKLYKVLGTVILDKNIGFMFSLNKQV